MGRDRFLDELEARLELEWFWFSLRARLYLNRATRTGRTAFRETQRWLARTLPEVGPVLRALPLAFLWLSFESYTGGWERLKSVLSALRLPTGGAQRLMFCLALSLGLGQLFGLPFAPLHFGAWLAWGAILHGGAIWLFWERGRRWTRKCLGVRPPRFADPKQAWNHLDLGH